MRKRTRLFIVLSVALLNLIALGGVVSVLAGDPFLYGAVTAGTGLLIAGIVLLAVVLAVIWVEKGD